ncbi:hypothetical protein, partial [Thauera sp.]|uniref:hypothetical protein n=1 Tax=Thauera sp. TaxID=1905334 RepID=UPI002C28E33A
MSAEVTDLDDACPPISPTCSFTDELLSNQRIAAAACGSSRFAKSIANPNTSAITRKVKTFLVTDLLLTMGSSRVLKIASSPSVSSLAG